MFGAKKRKRLRGGPRQVEGEGDRLFRHEARGDGHAQGDPGEQAEALKKG